MHDAIAEATFKKIQASDDLQELTKKAKDEAQLESDLVIRSITYDMKNLEAQLRQLGFEKETKAREAYNESLKKSKPQLDKARAELTAAKKTLYFLTKDLEE